MAQATKSRARPWYRIENAVEKDEATVYIYDEIVSGDGYWGGVPGEQFVREFAAITAPTIRVRVNSPGGDVFQATAIHQAIERHPSLVIAHVDGIAASASSWAILPANEVRIARGGFLMIHNAMAGRYGDARALRETAGVLDKVTGTIVDAYTRKTGKSAQEVQDWMDAETWFTAQEAMDAGFVDAIDEGQAAQNAAFDLSVYNRVPDAAMRMWNRAPEPTAPRIETIRDLERLLRDEGGYSHAAAKAIASRGFPALSDPREEDGEMANIMAALKRRSLAIPTA